MRDLRAIVVATLASFGSTAFGQTTVAGVTPASVRVTESGAAAYNVPIRVPPGIAGMQPNLALSFNSQGRNGLLGVGWSLSGLSAIYRCSKTIVQDGYTSGVNFDGNDRFCMDGQRLVAVSGSYGADQTEYRTERESFTKVLSYISGGQLQFRAWTKSGLIMEYGMTSDSWIEAQGSSAARAWALNKVSDKVGNYYTVTYQEDNANGDYRPSRIDYTGNSAGGVSTFASARFTYEDRADIKPAYVAGTAIKRMKRLINVKTYIGENPVTSYKIAYGYSPSGGPSRINTITECDGAEAQCITPISLTWQDPTGGGFTLGNLSGMPSGSFVVGDVNGDGKADLVWLSGGTLYVAYSNYAGNGFQSAVSIGSLAQGTPFIVGDFDGNGRADIVAQNGAVWLSTASGFTQTSWSGVSMGSVADFNGDGLADVAYASGGTAYILYSTGSGFQAAVAVGAVTAPIMVGDFDGNGRADIVDVNGNIWLSRAAGFVQASWPLGVSGIAGDFNGDGLADIAYESPAGTVVIRYSNGNGFDSASTFYAYPAGSTYVVGDVDGDGRTDFIATMTGGGAIWTMAPSTPDQVTHIGGSVGAAAYFAYKPLTDASVYTKGSSAVWPARDIDKLGPLYVVSSMNVDNGIGGSHSFTYAYTGAQTHVTGGGFLGFYTINMNDVDNSNTHTVSVFDQGYPYHGLTTLKYQQGTGGMFQRTDNSWTKTALTPAGGSGGNYHKAELTQAVARNYELDANNTNYNTVTTTTSYDGYSNPTSISISTADGYSSVTTNTYSNDTSAWILGRVTNSTVARTKPSGTAPLSLTRTFAFTYDPTTGLVTKDVAEPGDSNLCLVSTYQYDVFGNRTASTTRNCNGSAGEAAPPSGDAVFASRTSNTSFAATTANPVPGQFPTSASNALGHGESREFDSRFGSMTKLTGPNALATNWVYDTLGRKTSESRADGTSTTWSYSLCGTCPSNARYYVTATTAGRPAVTSYLDSLNRTIRTESPGFNGTVAGKDIQYDSVGHVYRFTQPYFVGATPQYTCYTYDPLHRVTSETRPTTSSSNSNCLASIARTTYSGFSSTYADYRGYQTTRTVNSQSQLTQVTYP